jgi:hypothetical protein
MLTGTIVARDLKQKTIRRAQGEGLHGDSHDGDRLVVALPGG